VFLVTCLTPFGCILSNFSNIHWVALTWQVASFHHGKLQIIAKTWNDIFQSVFPCFSVLTTLWGKRKQIGWIVFVRMSILLSVGLLCFYHAISKGGNSSRRSSMSVSSLLSLLLLYHCHHSCQCWCYILDVIAIRGRHYFLLSNVNHTKPFPNFV